MSISEIDTELNRLNLEMKRMIATGETAQLASLLLVSSLLKDDLIAQLRRTNLSQLEQKVAA